jgi:hypothetical protein
MKSHANVLAAGVACLALGVLPVSAGDIIGKVTYGGHPPPGKSITITRDPDICSREPQVDESLVVGPGKGLANVVVYIQDGPGAPAMPSPTPGPQLDQRSCRFRPHVLIVPAGGTLDVLNNDGVLHNLHTYPKNNPPVNRAQPKYRKVLPLTFEKPDFIRLACDVHPWMSGWLVVAPHAWYALTGIDGTFKIDRVAPGDYTLTYWQEILGRSG